MKVDYHSHFEGSIPWSAFATLFIKNKEELIETQVPDFFSLPFQLGVSKGIIQLLKDNISHTNLTKFLKSRFVLSSPAENLLDFIQRLPTAFIRWGCLNIEDLRFLLNEVINDYCNYSHVEVFFCPFALETVNYSWEDVCEMFSQVWLSFSPMQRNKFTFVLSLRKGQKDIKLDTVKKVVKLSNKYLNCGVTKIDICGDEDSYSYTTFGKQLEYLVKNSKLKLSLHIGETTDRDFAYVLGNFPEILQFNHGTKIVDSPDLLNIAKERNIFFTICPESNLYTGSLSFGGVNKLLRTFRENGIKYGWGSDDKSIIGAI